jgi:hypothetical protein
MLYRRGNIWHYDFTIAGRRQRGSTRQSSESRARKVESKLIAQTSKGERPASCAFAIGLRPAVPELGRSGPGSGSGKHVVITESGGPALTGHRWSV